MRGDEMSDQVELSQEEALKQKKSAHDYLATACHILKTRVQFYHEEFTGVFETVSFLENMRDQIRKDIEVVEPAKVEQKKPVVMDLTHVTAEAPQ